ncbi:hypothetical protein BBJ28_00026749, partial [Nothophytophthora sp. Chile5]
VKTLSELLGNAFSRSCVLITTKWPFRRGQLEGDAAATMRTFHSEFQKIAKDRTTRTFARCYAYSTASQQQEAAFVQAIGSDLESGGIKAMAVGVAKTWAEVVKVFMEQNRREDADFEFTANCLSDTIHKIADKISWYQKVIRPTALVSAAAEGTVAARCAFSSYSIDYRTLVLIGSAVTVIWLGISAMGKSRLRQLKLKHATTEEELFLVTQSKDRIRRQRTFV